MSGVVIDPYNFESEPIDWSPADLTNLVAWYDFSDISSLYQDTLKATPVTSDNDIIRAVADKSGNGRDLIKTARATTDAVYKENIVNGRSVVRLLHTDSLYIQDSIKAITDLGIIVAGAITRATDATFARNKFAQFMDASDATIEFGLTVGSLPTVSTRSWLNGIWTYYGTPDGLNEPAELTLSVPSYLRVEIPLPDSLGSIHIHDLDWPAANKTPVTNQGLSFFGIGLDNFTGGFEGDCSEVVLISSATAGELSSLDEYMNTRWTT